MIRIIHDFTLRTAVAPSAGSCRSPAWRAVLLAGVAGIALAMAAGAHPALADDSLGAPIAVEDLAEVRGGATGQDVHVNSHNTTNTATSTPTTTATNQDNEITVGGDMPSGNFIIHAGGISNNHGMTNIVSNTAPQSNVQGIMSMSVVLH